MPKSPVDRPAKIPSKPTKPTNVRNTSARSNEPSPPTPLLPVFPETPEMALQLWHGEMPNLPHQAMALYATTENDKLRQRSATNTLSNINASLIAGKASRLHEVNNGYDSDVSVGKVPKKRRTPRTMVSMAEEKFILNLHTCISMHLGFHAPCKDDEWCYCPLSRIVNKKWHEAVGFDSELEESFCNSNKSFRPCNLVSHLKEARMNILGTAIAI